MDMAILIDQMIRMIPEDDSLTHSIKVEKNGSIPTIKISLEPKNLDVNGSTLSVRRCKFNICQRK